MARTLIKAIGNDASTTEAGLVSTGAQTFAGAKTFNALTTVSGIITSSVTLDDDEAFTIPLSGTGRAMLFLWASASAVGSSAHAIIAFRVAIYVNTISIPANVTINAVGTALTTGPVNGVDGHLNVAVQNAAEVIIKNRTGGSKSWFYMIFGS